MIRRNRINCWNVFLVPLARVPRLGMYCLQCRQIDGIEPCQRLARRFPATRGNAERTGLRHRRNDQKQAINVRNAPKRCRGAPEYQRGNKTCRQKIEIMQRDEGGIGKVRADVALEESSDRAWQSPSHRGRDVCLLITVCDWDQISWSNKRFRRSGRQRTCHT
jgi:hypothetical protein